MVKAYGWFTIPKPSTIVYEIQLNLKLPTDDYRIKKRNKRLNKKIGSKFLTIWKKYKWYKSYIYIMIKFISINIEVNHVLGGSLILVYNFTRLVSCNPLTN